jgi:predicted membrane protein
MTTEDSKNPITPSNDSMNNKNNGRVISGIILVAVGAVFLARQMGVFFPNWLFSWPMFMIVLGFFIGAKHNFQRGGWWIVSLIGAIFLTDRLVPGVDIGKLFWPVFLIIVGLVFIFRPKKSWNNQHWKQKCREKMEGRYNHNHYTENSDYETSPEDYINSTSIFGGIKKNVISKNFKGGDIVCVFGGSEINLMQADFNGRIEIEVVQIFGGTKLIIPAHWEVVHEMVAIMGGIEDKRSPFSEKNPEETKRLVIRGTSVFGGIDIRSY